MLNSALYLKVISLVTLFALMTDFERMTVF